MKIGLFIENLKGGGAERVVSVLLQNWDKNIQVVLFTLSDDMDYRIPEGVHHEILTRRRMHRNGLALVYSFFNVPVLLTKAYRRYDLDLILCFNVRPNIYAAIAKKFLSQDLRVIISERSYPSKQYFGMSVKSCLMKMLIRYFYNSADKVLSNAMGNRLDLIENFRVESQKICVVNNPIDRSSKKN